MASRKKEKEVVITEEEWAAAVEGFIPDDPGETSSELGKRWGISEHAAKRRAKKLVEAGRFLQGMCMRADSAGRKVPRPVYRPAPQTRGKKR